MNTTNVSVLTNATQVNKLSPSLSQLCGSILMVLSISGLMVYVAFIFIVFTRKKFNSNAYFHIAAWLGVADCVCLILMMTYAAPCIIMRSNLNSYIFIGGILNVGWFSGLPLILFLAINRYLCICHTELCRRMYSIKLSKIYCLVCFLFGVAYSIPSFFECCPIYFDYVLMTWGWDIDKFGSVVLSYGELGMVIIVTLIAMGLNLMVLREIRKAHRNTVPLGATHEHKKLARERKVFFQFFITIIWLIIFDIPFITIGYLENPSHWLGYFVSLVYTMNCSVNGWVYLLLNRTVKKEFKAIFFCLKDDDKNEGGKTFCISEEKRSANKVASDLTGNEPTH